MLDTHTRMLFSLSSNSFVSGNIYYYAFSNWLHKIESSDSDVEFDEDLLLEEDVSAFLEWLLIVRV